MLQEDKKTEFIYPDVTGQDSAGKLSLPVKHAIKITAVYAFLGGLWIIFSDIVALKLFGDQDFPLVQTAKGLSFIIITSALVYWLASRATSKVEHEMQNKQLAMTKSLIQAVFASMGDAVFIIDFKNRAILDCNTAAENMFDYSRDELLGQTTEFLYVDEKEFHQIGVMAEHALECNGTFRTDYRMRSKDGTVLDVEIVVKEMDPVIGWRGGVVSVIRDISVRKKEEKERLKLIEELEKRNEELETFTYTISHDLKSPLVTIGGFAGQLREDFESGNTNNVREAIDFIESSTQRMAILINNLLHLARSGKVIDEPQSVDLIQIAGEVVESIQTNKETCRIRFNLPDDMPSAYGDPARLKEVFQNLLENAIKFTDTQTNPEIEITIKPEGGKATCFISDNGTGIPSEFQEKVFGLFERLDPSKDGSGIGLAIVRRIIKEHGGKVWVESSNPSDGTTIGFTVPLDEAVQT